MKTKFRVLAVIFVIFLPVVLYHLYIFLVPSTPAAFFRSGSLPEYTVRVRYSSPGDTADLDVELTAAQREALAGCLSETEVRRYALWEPWDANTAASSYLHLSFFHEDTGWTIMDFPPNGHFLLFWDQKYYLPQSAALHEEILNICYSE